MTIVKYVTDGINKFVLVYISGGVLSWHLFRSSVALSIYICLFLDFIIGFVSVVR
jgi:hypothetical protein